MAGPALVEEGLAGLKQARAAVTTIKSTAG
jgi:hypothetical protein